jgi:hypothetical protein
VSGTRPLGDPDDDPRCEWCRLPIPDGEARVRLFSIVYHLACWDAKHA